MRRWAWGRALRLASWVLLALVLLIAGSIAYVGLVFDPNSLKPNIVAWMHARYQRQVTIAGDIQLKFWPRAHLELAGISLSESNATSTFASLRRAFATVRLLPLLRRQVKVDALSFEGLSLSVRRFADGRLNIDDLLPSGGASNWDVDIAQLALRETSLSLQDDASGERWQASKLQLTAGRLALGKPGELIGGFELLDGARRVQLKVSVAGAYLARAQPFALELHRFNVSATGRARDFAIEQLQFAGSELAQRADAGWQANDLRLNGRAARAAERFTLQAHCPRLTRAAEDWRASGASAKLTRELAQEKQEISLTLDALRSRSGEFGAPDAKIGLVAHGSSGEWGAQLRGPIEYELRSGRLRSNRAKFDASWRRDSHTLRLGGDAYLVARPAQGVWQAAALNFKLNGATPLGELEASGRGTAGARTQGQRYALTLDALQLDAKSAALRIEAGTTQALTMSLSGDALEAALNEVRLRLSNADLALSGKVDVALAGSLAQGSYALKPLALRLAGKRSGASIELGLHSSALVDARAQQVRLSTSDTSIRIGQLSSSKKKNEVTLIGVFDLDWGKSSAGFAGSAKLDASNLKGRVGWAGDPAGRAAAPYSYSFDLDIDALDWDRYAGTSSTQTAPQRTPSSKASPWLDLSQLRALRAKGVARIGVLKAGGATARGVTLEVQ